MAVIHLFGPLSLFWRYWRISLADFIASMVAFWTTIFVSAEIGIGAAAGFSVLWSLIRQAFNKPEVRTGGHNNSRHNTSARSPTSSSSQSDPEAADRVSSRPQYIPGRRLTNATDISEKGTAAEIEMLDRQETLIGRRPSTALAGGGGGGGGSPYSIPEDTAVVRFTDNIFFPNAYRGKTTALEGIQLVYAPPSSTSSSTTAKDDQMWTVSAERRLTRLRAQHDIVPKTTPLALVIWDMTRVSWIDTTGIVALGELKDDIHRQLGGYVQVRMVGLNAKVRRKFWRAKWKLVDAGESRAGVEGDVVYEMLEDAVWRDRESFGGKRGGGGEDDGASFEGVTLEKN